MLKKGFLLFSLLLFISCSSNSVFLKVNWHGNLVQHDHEINYLFWRDGVQFNLQQKDSLSVNLAGFSQENVIYVLVSLTNESGKPVTFTPADCRINYLSGKKVIELKPIRPKNLDKDHFSFFNTVLVGAGSISRLFINLPIDMLLKPKENDDTALSNIDQEFHDEGARITKKIFISTHTLFPETNYAGFLVFEYDEDMPVGDQKFEIQVKLADHIFEGQGNFIK